MINQSPLFQTCPQLKHKKVPESMPNAKDMLVRKLRLSKLERVSIPFYMEYGNSEEILP
jgi:hypothetical protein